MDLQMFSQMRQKLPGITVTNEVVEPSSDMLFKYKGKFLTHCCLSAFCVLPLLQYSMLLCI